MTVPQLPRPLSATRPVYVYRLEISYPEGSDAPGWRPARWDAFLQRLPARSRRKARKAGFRWPRERMFLSSSGAYGRAAQLRWAGADVEVIRSGPVFFPAPLWEETDGMRDAGGLITFPLPGYLTDTLRDLPEDAVIVIFDGKGSASLPGAAGAGPVPSSRWPSGSPSAASTEPARRIPAPLSQERDIP